MSISDLSSSLNGNSSHIGYRLGRLTVEGVSVDRIIREVGTPTYVYSSAAIRDRYLILDRAFSAPNAANTRGRHMICYALKANSNLSVCRLLRDMGAGADVVSGGELRRALTVGFDPRRIIVSGVGKTEDEIAYALKVGVLALNVESEEELAAVSRCARKARIRAPISVRVNPDVDAHTHALITTGRADNKFGIERSRIIGIYRRITKDPWLRAVGIQCHIGSQITRVGPYAQALNILVQVVSNLARSGVRLDFIDIGGGMGISYKDEKPLPVESLAAEVWGALKNWPDLRVLMEPGRFLTADAGMLLTQVLYRKRTSRSRFVVIDAAMNDLLRPALYGAYHPIVPAAASRGKKMALDVVGPICETADCFAKKRLLPWPEAGDVWAILKTGAYGFAMSSQYNSRPRAAEVLVDGRIFRVVCQRESFEDLIRHER